MEQPPRPLIGIVWLLAAAILLLGGYKLLHLKDRSADQQILLDKSHR